jgi:hypothetical protein
MGWGTDQKDGDGCVQHYVHDDAGYLAWIFRLDGTTQACPPGL